MPLLHSPISFSRFKKAKVFNVKELRNGKTIMNFSELDIFRFEARHSTSFLCRYLYSKTTYSERGFFPVVVKTFSFSNL
jgi:hypothetical protein